MPPPPATPARTQICLDSLSDAKEMENLARRAASREASPPPPPLSSTASPRKPPPPDGPLNSNGGGGGQPPSKKGKGGKNGDRRGRSPPASPSAAVAAAAGGWREDDPQGHSSTGVSDAAEGTAEGGGGGEGEGEEEPWGVLLRNTIIRDLSGFGMEHAGPIGRSLISQVLAVSQDNYPEMVSG